MKPQSISVPCAGYSLAADWYRADYDQTIIVMVGRTSSKAIFAYMAQELVERTGMNVLIFDYSGHGESPFQLDDLSHGHHLLEVVTVFDWLRREEPSHKIHVFGTSYGGFLGAWLASFRSFGKLVLAAPAIYMPEDFYTVSKHYRADAEVLHYRRDTSALARHPIWNRAADFTGQALVVVHEHDERIPRETTNRFVKAFAAKEMFVKDVVHSIDDDAITMEQTMDYQDRISAWLLKSRRN